MSYLLANLLGALGLTVVFYLSGLVFDLASARGHGLHPFPIVGRLALGAALWMAVLFVLASAGLLRAGVIAALLALLLLAAVASRRSAVAAISTVGRSLRRPDAAGILLGAVVTVVLAALWLQAQWPQVSWDAEVYHLTVPRLYLENEGFRRVPFNVYSNWPLNVQLLFGLAMLVKDHVLAKLIHFGFGCATLLLVYRLAAGARRPWAGWVAAALFLANPVVLQEFRVAYVDLAIAFFFLLAFAYLHHGLERSDERGRALLWAGVFGGVAAGVKPTGLVVPVALAVVFLAVALRRRERRDRMLAGLARLLVPAALLLAPWLAKSWILTGNPVYPFLYEVFDGPEWSSELGAMLRTWQYGIGMGRGWSDYLLLPLRVILAGDRGYGHFDGRIQPLWLLLIPLAIWGARRSVLVHRALWLAALYFVSWSLSSQQMRFLIALLPLLSVSSAVAMADLVEHRVSTRAGWVRTGISLVLASILALTEPQLAGQSWTMLRDYLRSGADVERVAVRPAFEFIDRELPETAKLLFLNTNHGFFCRRAFIADSFFEASQINALMKGRTSTGEIRQLMSELGVSHLLIENRQRFVPWPRALYDFLNDRELTRLLFRSPDGLHDVVEVVGGDASP